MNIPEKIKKILAILQKAGYEAYIVGGCVRDLLIGKPPADWDVTTNAKPQEIEGIFGSAGYKTVYENDFGTVSVLLETSDPSLRIVEITPFRIESKYTDKRHPDKVRFAETLQEDLGRRDFTINAMAIQIKNGNSKLKITDLFGGQKDLENKTIRAVGEPEERFQEDALRLMRAVRFCSATEPDKMWQIEPKTYQAMAKNCDLLKHIAQERIRDELIKIIQSKNAAKAIELLRRTGLLQHVLPELLPGFGGLQNKHHIFQVYEHGLLSLHFACQKNFSLEVRLAALLHDIAKPQTKTGKAGDLSFYNHEIVGAKITERALKRLRFTAKQIAKITKLVRFHLFYYNVGEVTETSVRRLLRKVGQEDITELLQVRMADRIGSGVPKAEPYKLRHLKYLFEKVSGDPIAPKMLKANGNDIMQILGIKPGIKIGQILSILLSDVLSDPVKNDRPHLLGKIKELGSLEEKDLQKLAQKAQNEIEQIETKKDEMTKAKYWVT
ncbi:MAG: HD domain-containing protein [Patescibacteria group bacterium]|nr:HD domain-containing protein [Patescibacteria group bacterium]